MEKQFSDGSFFEEAGGEIIDQNLSADVYEPIPLERIRKEEEREKKSGGSGRRPDTDEEKAKAAADEARYRAGKDKRLEDEKKKRDGGKGPFEKIFDETEEEGGFDPLDPDSTKSPVPLETIGTKEEGETPGVCSMCGSNPIGAPVGLCDACTEAVDLTDDTEYLGSR